MIINKSIVHTFTIINFKCSNQDKDVLKDSNVFLGNKDELYSIEQKGMTLVPDFCYSFSFSSSLFF